ncbi:hypothetical protein DRP05_03575 [Archaeoglobales archaeon]|nr:MAG: hypothetical protein DRP05_03575 [Archaeoglobales archaeon]
MRLVVLLALLTCITTISSAECINEYRYAVFYPNGTQVVFEDWFAGNLTNNYPHQINSINVTYRDATAFIPSINPGESKGFSKTLKPKNFNIGVKIYAEGDRNAFSIVYEIENFYNFTVSINISIPKPDFATSWENCSLIGKNLVSNFFLPPNTKYFIRIRGSGNYAKVDDSLIDFSIPSKANISFSAPTVFSITKELDNGTWYANYSIKNKAECTLKINGTTWAETDTKHNLFNFSTILNPNETWSKKTKFESEVVPTFYIKYVALNYTQCDVVIKPVYKVGNNYVIGMAKVFGTTFNFGAVAGGVGGVGHGILVTPTPKSTKPAQPVQPTQPTLTPPTQPTKPTPIPTPPMPIPTPPIIIPTKITKEKAKTYVAYTLPVAYATATSLIVSPVFRRRGFVVDGKFLDAIGDKAILFSRYARRMYTTSSNARPFAYVVDLNVEREMVESIAIRNGLSVEETESIILAIQMKRPLFIADEKAAEVARRYGVLAYTVEDIIKYSYV